MKDTDLIPVVMTFSCSDPTGCAGIQADIETLFGLGCKCASVITSIVIMDPQNPPQNVAEYEPIATSLVIEQARMILAKKTISAIKIGRMGNVENLTAIYTLLKNHNNIPIVLDLGFNSVGTTGKPDQEIADAITSLLCPLTTILTINTETAQILTPGSDNSNACAQKLMEYGCDYILLKDCFSSETKVENNFYSNHRLLDTFQWKRIPGNYRGCSDTLSAAIAALLAYGLTPMDCIVGAQNYTWKCIKRGSRFEKEPESPNRLLRTSKSTTVR